VHDDEDRSAEDDPERWSGLDGAVTGSGRQFETSR
jgi:hypothetical protein